MVIASIVIFAFALYCTIALIANAVTAWVRVQALLALPADVRQGMPAITIVDVVTSWAVVTLWTAFYALRVYA